MSAPLVNSPIQRLNLDIIWCIVQINADIFDDTRALETTLATSRVCRDWRSLMLSTSSIWAHLVDLDHRLWRTIEGSSELIRRSGTALLWIKSHHLHDRTRQCVKNILGIVVGNWERVQKLEVILIWTHQHMEQWSQLYLPAPHLEAFSIGFTREYEYPVIGPIMSSLFGRTAPMLRHLRFDGHRSTFTNQPAWLHQLCSLDLSVELTVSETLEMLMLTKNLVILRLDHILPDYHTSPSLPLVSLPKLADLELNPFKLAGLTTIPVLLEHIYIPPTCSRTITVCSIRRRDLNKKGILATIIRAISTCTRPHFTHHIPRQLGLGISADHFIIQTVNSSNEFTFQFLMQMASQHTLPQHTLSMLLTEFTLPSFSSVTFFDFVITDMNRTLPAFTAFLASLPSINTVKTDKWSLRHIRHPGSGITFPALSILKLDSFLHSRSDRSKLNGPDPVSEYVMARIGHGHAISILDFTEDTLDALPDMECLNKADGLKVRWQQRGVPKVCEYICGMGVTQSFVSM